MREGRGELIEKEEDLTTVETITGINEKVTKKKEG